MQIVNCKYLGKIHFIIIWIRKRSFNRFTISSIVQNKNDIRPFTHIDIFGQSHLALLDSGANKSVIGGELAQQLISSKPFNKFKSVVRTADGQTQNVAGTIQIPLT
ncbi:hypothetical protein A7M48_20240 [Acinetobacter baumannii]|nr:hypothetical protein A7M48_20240 [Acinetobacter baumannii]